MLASAEGKFKFMTEHYFRIEVLVNTVKDNFKNEWRGSQRIIVSVFSTQIG